MKRLKNLKTCSSSKGEKKGIGNGGKIGQGKGEGQERSTGKSNNNFSSEEKKRGMHEFMVSWESGEVKNSAFVVLLRG